MRRLYIYSCIIITMVAGGLIYLYHEYFGLTKKAYESALNSFIVSLFVFAITVIVINFLFSYHHQRINEKKDKEEYLHVLREAHKGLVFQLKTFIITFITKEMAKTKLIDNVEVHIMDLESLKNNLDQYITSDFTRKSIKVTQPGKFNLFEYETVEQNHTTWLSDNNNKILAIIHKYLMLYSNLMPKSVLKTLVEIELLITRNSVFMVPNIKSFQDHINVSVIDDKSIEVAKEQLKKIINKIIEFEKIIDTK